MPKPKGSPKTGGRKKLPEGSRVNLQIRCSPEEAEKIKEFIKQLRA